DAPRTIDQGVGQPAAPVAAAPAASQPQASKPV
ncbi:MAG: hypothetical protein JWN93_2765, partial [Hyphomicrobiales bacterium]|nr:hypothetical protein [Hyphomicrobiales bacterium]